MSKSIFIFTILVVFVGIAVWFVVQKTKDVSQTAISPTPTATPMPSPEAGQPVRYDNGLVVQDIVVGGGNTAENGDTLSVHYVGALENGTAFDSSYKRGQPIQFVLGSGQLIRGWELGLVGMKESGKRKLVIPPSLGYGSKGAGGGVIPPNAILLFEIELVSVQKK